MNPRKALPRYFSILEKNTPAKFMIAKRITADFDDGDDLDSLWKKHDKALHEFYITNRIKEKPEKSLLYLKIALANKNIEKCELCERKCSINRKKEKGLCKSSNRIKIASEFIHLFEESWISPSHTVFFSGCNWSCVYCQNYDISHYNKGLYIRPKNLAEIIEEKSKIAKNVNFVGGDPTPHIHGILETLKYCNVNIPVVFNSNAYLTEKAMELLEGIVDVFLFDFRYFNDECAKRLSNVENCREILTRNHLLARKQAELSIRLLVLPNHIECCDKKILEWISKNVPEAIVNLMNQYRPVFRAYEYSEINRPLKKEEFEEVVKYAEKLELNFTA